MIDRLKKKCFLGSVLGHGLLCGVVLFGAAFGGPKEPPPQFVSLVNLDLPVTDAPSSGGNPAPPAAQPAPQPKAAEPPPPAPEPVKPQPVEPVKPVVVPKPAPQPKPEPDPVDKPLMDPVLDRAQMSVSAAPKKPTVKKPHKVEVDLGKKVNLKPAREEARAKEEQEEREAAEAAAKANRERWANLKNAVSGARTGVTSSIRNSGAKGVEVDSIGDGLGGGGAAFANYTHYVYSAYFAAWVPPDSIASDKAIVTAIVVVGRDGSIISAEISDRSSDSSLNRSVERALRKVEKLPAFPSETRDLKRSFRIEFNPQALKESLG